MATQRFYNATDKLVNAFLMDKIVHNSCWSCAVGTLCGGNRQWILAHSDINNEREAGVDFLVKTTEYSLYEIYEIEKRFENRKQTLLDDLKIQREYTQEDEEYESKIADEDPDGFMGLYRVFDYMVSIEDWREEEKGTNIFELLEQLN